MLTMILRYGIITFIRRIRLNTQTKEGANKLKKSTKKLLRKTLLITENFVNCGLGIFTGLISICSITNKKIFNDFFAWLNVSNFDKWVFALFIVFIILKILFWDINRNSHIIRKGSGIYIDCKDEYTENEEVNAKKTNETISSINFSSKNEFVSFFKNENFTDEQIRNISKISYDGKVELPDKEKIHCISFNGEENILCIEWYGGNDYMYSMTAVSECQKFDFSMRHIADIDMLDEFHSKKKRYKKLCLNKKYKKDGIKYIEYNGIETSDTRLYWSFSEQEITYYIYQLSYSEKTDMANDVVEILIAIKDGYQIVYLHNLNGIEITPEFVKQFIPYIYSIDQ